MKNQKPIRQTDPKMPPQGLFDLTNDSDKFKNPDRFNQMPLRPKKAKKENMYGLGHVLGNEILNH